MRLHGAARSVRRGGPKKLEVLKMSPSDTMVPYGSAPGAPAPDEALGLMLAPQLSRVALADLVFALSAPAPANRWARHMAHIAASGDILSPAVARMPAAA
jgi:hypothetical protein